MTPVDRPRRGEATSHGSAEQTVARRAVRWMLLAVLSYALLPLIVWAGVRDMSPFTFVAVWYALSAAFQATLRQAQTRLSRQQSRKRLTIVDDLRSVKPRYFWLSAATRLEYLWFALAVTLVEPVVATVVFEFWPVVFGLLTLAPIWRDRMLEGGRATKGELGKMLIMLLIGGVGVSLAVLSDTGSLGWSSAAVVGVLLAFLSTLSFWVISNDLPDDGC